MSGGPSSGATEKEVDTASFSEGDLVQAFKDLARGERTASALEQQLSGLEDKIDQLMARAEEEQRGLDGKQQTESGPQNGEPKTK
ncbi:MAG: hypothetical protein M1828_005518 [Chrysothrix sp. TS-e1954]|nr:MAG: hypothetical protein M1828_005518 [Chrysothrix sp. TS-e1954]